MGCRIEAVAARPPGPQHYKRKAGTAVEKWVVADSPKN